jgi:hypothetical protein
MPHDHDGGKCEWWAGAPCARPGVHVVERPPEAERMVAVYEHFGGKRMTVCHLHFSQARAIGYRVAHPPPEVPPTG